MKNSTILVIVAICTIVGAAIWITYERHKAMERQQNSEQFRLHIDTPGFRLEGSGR
jgi:predicted negative regulator of RcsB-dependent stress response